MALVRASALNGSAWNNAQLGELSTARANCLQAIELCRAIGYSPGEAGAWDTLGVVDQRLGDHASAVTCSFNAITLDREMGNRYDLAMVLLHLGDTYAIGFNFRSRMPFKTCDLSIESRIEFLQFLGDVLHLFLGRECGNLPSSIAGRQGRLLW